MADYNIRLGLFAAAAGTVDAITATYSPVPASLYDGLMLWFRATGANTSTTPTFSPNSLTARTIVKEGGQALVAGDIPTAGAVMAVVYDLANTRWELTNPAVPTSGGSQAIKGADNFTTTGGGASPALTDEDSGNTFVALGVTVVDVWLNQTGEQGVKIPTADYTYTAGTGVITGLEASKNYTAYGR